MGDLIPANDATQAPLQARIQYAHELAKAGIIPTNYRGNPANILVAIDYGAALGIPAMQAINQINVIEGRPTISSDLMASLVRRAGHRLRITQTNKPLAVTATLTRADDPEFEFAVTWDMHKAEQAGLTRQRGNRPGPWQQYPDQMLRARAISEICRQAASDALAGVIYTPEELHTATQTERTQPAKQTHAEEITPAHAQQARGDRPGLTAIAAQIGWGEHELAAMAQWASGGLTDNINLLGDTEYERVHQVALQRLQEAQQPAPAHETTQPTETADNNNEEEEVIQAEIITE